MSCNCKSSMTAYNYTQTIALNAVMPFIVEEQYGKGITYDSSSNTFKLNKAGRYRVTIQGTATGSVDATAVSMQINRAGNALKTGLATFTPATAEGNAESMSASTIVTVNNTCPYIGTSYIGLTITNTASEATYTVYSIVIEEI